MHNIIITFLNTGSTPIRPVFFNLIQAGLDVKRMKLRPDADQAYRKKVNKGPVQTAYMERKFGPGR